MQIAFQVVAQRNYLTMPLDFRLDRLKSAVSSMSVRVRLTMRLSSLSANRNHPAQLTGRQSAQSLDEPFAENKIVQITILIIRSNSLGNSGNCEQILGFGNLTV